MSTEFEQMGALRTTLGQMNPDLRGLFCGAPNPPMVICEHCGEEYPKGLFCTPCEDQRSMWELV